MLILGRDRLKDPTARLRPTFVRQLEDCLGLGARARVRIVANAGGLNPAGLADAVRELADRLGLDAAVAHVEGDDLLPRADELGLGAPLTANAYLGALRHRRRACAPGADVVVTGRVTDASLVVGPGGRALRLGPRRRTTSWPAPWSPATSRVRHPGHRRQLLGFFDEHPPSSCCTRASRSPRSPPTAPA